MTSALSHLECARCGRTHDAGVLQQRCPGAREQAAGPGARPPNLREEAAGPGGKRDEACGGALLARYGLDGLSLDDLRRRPAGMWRYRELLPVQGDPVSLGEPETALLALPQLSERWGCEAFLKDDGALAGGSFKARGAAVGLSRAAELGASGVVMPSAGNAGGAWSVYAARARMPITVTMARTAPLANQAEVRSAGGELVLVDGTIADAGSKAVELARSRGAFLATTFSEPYRLEGKKSCWLEVFDRLGDGAGMRFPKTIVLPVGGGVAAVAAAKGAEEVVGAGWCGDDPPAIVGVQAAGCAPVVKAFEVGADEVQPWERRPDTVAAGLRVPRPPEGALLLRSVRGSGGTMMEVDDDAIISAISSLASSEGVFACPEGAAAVAAADQLARAGRLESPVVIYNTGAGAKYATDLAERL